MDLSFQNPAAFQQPSGPSFQNDPHSRHLTPAQAQAPPNRYGAHATQYPMANAMHSSGVMMQPAIVHNQQQRLGGQQHFYTSAPYSQPIPTSAVSAQPHLSNANSTVTPPRNFSPYTSTPQSQQHTPSPALGPGQQPMAAPLTSNPQPQAGAVQSPVKAATQIPQSPDAQARDRERVTLLLEINQILLQEIISLQEQGKGGDIQSVANSKSEEKKDPEKQASSEYVEYMRRMQANLAYLANVAERAARPNSHPMPWPPILTTPSNPPELMEMYKRVQDMFPGWKAQQAKSSASPHQAPHGGGAPTSQMQGQGMPHMGPDGLS